MSQIISVGSYRRAVGKSIIAANLAVQASVRGWRVGIAELNVLEPLSQSSFGIPDTTGSLVSYLHGEITAEAVGADAFASQEDGSGLWIFPWASPVVWEKEEVDPAVLSQRLQALANHHQLDFLILDLGAGITDFNLLMAGISDCCLVVTRGDQMDYQGTAIMVDLIRSMNDSWVLLIANQVLDSFDPAQVREQITGIFQAPACVLPFSGTILEMGSGGFFSLHLPDHEWSRGIRSMSASLFSDLAGRLSEPDSLVKPRSSFSRQLHELLTRRFLPTKQRPLAQKLKTVEQP